MISDHKVRHGPFKGMQYPFLDSVGSTLFPKLLGSYERELHDTLQSLLPQSYDCLIDIGCGEGYYAVGIGMRIPSLPVYAFDCNHRARQLTETLSSANKVSLSVEGCCTPPALERLASGSRALIISDCEGYEMELFENTSIEGMAQADLLIECHNGVDPNTTDYLVRRFSATHQCVVIEALSDYKRGRDTRAPELERLSLGKRIRILAEMRHPATEWLVCRSRDHSLA